MNSREHPQSLVMTEAQLGAALQLLGAQVTPLSPLDPMRPAPEPNRILQGTPFLGAGGNRVAPRLAELLQRAAAPERVISCVVSTTGESRVRRVAVCQPGPASDGKGVAVEKSPDGTYRLQPLPDANAAVAHVEGLLHASELSAPGEADEIRLTLPAYGALLAAADATQAAALRLRLARGNSIKPVLVSALLDGVLRDGLRLDDNRWAVCASRFISPANLALTQGAMPIGLQQLADAGVVKPISRGFAFTSRGERAIDALGELRCAVHVAVFLPGREPSRPAAQATFFVGRTSASAANWAEMNAASAAGEWLSLGAPEIAARLRTLFATEAPPPPRPPAKERGPEPKVRTCPACHTTAAANARFCSNCGADLNEPIQRRCSNPACRQPIPAGRKFCTACGQRVEPEKAAR